MLTITGVFLLFNGLVTGYAGALGCGGGLSAEDEKSVRSATKLTALTFRYIDGGAARALVRGAYCATNNTLTRHHLEGVDAGVTCGP
jgi:hypothetical protein